MWQEEKRCAPKGEEGLSGWGFSYCRMTLIPGPRSSGARSRTSALSTVIFRLPCELRTTGQDSLTSSP